jgi:hypothetical protein
MIKMSTEQQLTEIIKLLKETNAKLDAVIEWLKAIEIHQIG